MSSPMALAENEAPTARRADRLLAPLCITIALLLLRHRTFERVVAIAAWANRRCPRTATTEEAASMTQAVRAAARHRDARVACLEYSLATVILAAVRRRTVQWCIGARMMPYASHAWIEIDREAVGEPDHDRPYLVLLRVA